MLVKNSALSKTAPKQPLVGITMRLSAAHDFYLRREYAEAIERFGGAPIYLPLLARREYANRVLETVDAILLPGSDSDVDPLLYDEEPLPRCGAVQPARDRTDLLFIERAEEMKIPILGICYGMQILNVARGGSLLQDIETEHPNALAHQQGAPRERLSQRIRIEEDSFLRGLTNDSSALINTHHHQAVKKIGENLKIAARASDGIVEAVEDARPGVFAVGVQWHPELCWRDDIFSQNLFAAFIAAASQTRNRD